MISASCKCTWHLSHFWSRAYRRTLGLRGSPAACLPWAISQPANITPSTTQMFAFHRKGREEREKEKCPGSQCLSRWAKALLSHPASVIGCRFGTRYKWGEEPSCGRLPAVNRWPSTFNNIILYVYGIRRKPTPYDRRCYSRQSRRIDVSTH